MHTLHSIHTHTHIHTHSLANVVNNSCSVGCNGVDLYSETDCDGACDGAGAHVSDASGVCCERTDIDCLGFCDGDHVVGLNTARTWLL